MSALPGVIDVRNDAGSARVGDVRDLATRVGAQATATTGTIAVTANATYDVSFTQPAGTSIQNIIMIAAGNLVTAGSSGDDIDFDLGTAAGGGQIIDEKAIADDGGSAVTIAANTPLFIVENGLPAVANKFANMSGGPSTSEALTLAASLASTAERTLHILLKPLASNLATAATTVTFVIDFITLP